MFKSPGCHSGTLETISVFINQWSLLGVFLHVWAGLSSSVSQSGRILETFSFSGGNEHENR